MADRQVPGLDEVQPQESARIDGILYNGVDGLAARRAHLRGLTMARQAAERQNARPPQAGLARWEQRAAARERSLAMHAELARIDAEHLTWLREQGVAAPERRTRRRRVPAAVLLPAPPDTNLSRRGAGPGRPELIRARTATFDDQARRALAADREDLARLALSRKAEMVQQVQSLQAQVETLQGQQEQLQAGEQRLAAKIEAFRTRKETIKE